MGDDIIDTNVLLVASAQDPGSPFKDNQVPAEQQQIVLNWLMAFREDRQRKVVLDQSLGRKGSIWKEYNNKMTGQDIGLLVVMEKLQLSLVRFVDIAYDANDHGCLPADLKKVDPSDRKFVAVALMDMSQGGKSTIVNAVDADWCECEEELMRFGIAVRHLIDDLYRDWQRKKQEAKRARPRKKPDR